MNNQAMTRDEDMVTFSKILKDKWIRVLMKRN
jgi:hypothetical protein